MGTLGFDTHAYVKKLKAVGFTEEQAEVQTQVIAALIESHLATKRDLKEVEAALQRDIQELRRDTKELETTLRRDMKELETVLRQDMQAMELRLRHDLTLRLGTMLAAGIAVVAALMKLL
jgi:predicted phage-related endonuclease